VIGQESQICPAFILKVNLNEKLQRTLGDWNRESEQQLEKTHKSRELRLGDKDGGRQLVTQHSVIGNPILIVVFFFHSFILFGFFLVALFSFSQFSSVHRILTFRQPGCLL
jgi:hypothetical protein